MHWSKNPKMREKVLKKIVGTQFKKGQPSLKGMLGKKHSEEWKINQSNRMKEEYKSGKINPMLEKIPWNKGKKCNYLIKNNHAKENKPNETSFKKGEQNKNFGKDWSNMKGKNHWNYKDGITPYIVLLRQSAMYQIWRNAVFLRDDFTCQDCGRRGIFLHAHHIKSFADYSELRFKIENGQTLCKNCHAKLHASLRRTALVIG